MASAIAVRDLRPHRFDLVLIGTALAMTVATVLLVVDPSLRIVFVDRTMDVAMSSFSALAAVGLAILTVPRYRESLRLALLLQATAFVTLAAFSGGSVVVVLLKLDDDLGMALGAPEQLPLWISAANRIVVSVLFLGAGIAAVREIRRRMPRPRLLAMAPAIALAAAALLLAPLRGLLPDLIGPDGIEALLALTGITQGPESTTSRLPDITSLELAGVATAVVLMMGAAVLFRTSYVRRGRESEAYLAVGLVIAAFAELQHAFYPSVYTGLVTASDAMRLVSYGILVMGIVAEQREDLRDLRTAYTALDRLRVTEAERAALEERHRLAREIHDGLAQQLWFTKLKFERLASSLDESAKSLASEVGQSLDAAIVEARSAMVTMRSSLEADLPLADMLGRAIDDFEQRSGLPVRFTPGPGLPGAIPARQQIELLRVVQEALTNVTKHADATMVRLRAEAVGQQLVVTVADNGIGFDTSQPPEGGMGLRGMEERARLMGGTLRVESELHGGTTVEASVPILVGGWVPGMAELADGERVTDTVSVPADTSAAAASAASAASSPVPSDTGPILTRPVP